MSTIALRNEIATLANDMEVFFAASNHKMADKYGREIERLELLLAEVETRRLSWSH
tara:strand:+ start:317 stop:484 length:168 start_codon:yes stop_codon:yes gene_type:complete